MDYEVALSGAASGWRLLIMSYGAGTDGEPSTGAGIDAFAPVLELLDRG